MCDQEYKAGVVYLDNAATTRMAEEAEAAMQPYLVEKFGNASTAYGYGEEAQAAIAHAREVIAASLDARPSEIYFTSGGSEADNWAVKGVAEAYGKYGRHIITSRIEHHAVLNSCHYLEEQGYEVTYLDVDQNGMISLEQLEQAVREDTILISVMFGNNEVGTIEPVMQIGRLQETIRFCFIRMRCRHMPRFRSPCSSTTSICLARVHTNFTDRKVWDFCMCGTGLRCRPLSTAAARSVENVRERRMYQGSSGWGRRWNWHFAICAEESAGR